MKTIHLVVLILTLLLFPACGPGVNDPATAKALEDLNKGYNEATNSRDLDWIKTNYYTDDAVMLPAHQLLLKGKEAVLARDQSLFDQYGTIQFDSSIEEILSSGDLAVARRIHLDWYTRSERIECCQNGGEMDRYLQSTR